jgi:hypothetical protein
VTDARDPTWKVIVERRPLLACCALWVRAAERIETRADPLVPGPLNIDVMPNAAFTGDRGVLAEEWVQWWHSIVGPPRDSIAGAGEPAHGTIDPLGLAGRTTLASVVADRGAEAVGWHRAGPSEQHTPTDESRLVRAAERKLGRPAGVFDLHLTLLPVRDTEIREAAAGRQYLVPEGVFGSPEFRAWLAQTIEKIM